MPGRPRVGPHISTYDSESDREGEGGGGKGRQGGRAGWERGREGERSRDASDRPKVGLPGIKITDKVAGAWMNWIDWVTGPWGRVARGEGGDDRRVRKDG